MADLTKHERFEGERTLMRIHIGESDRWHGKPLYEAIVELLRREKLSGATVLRGVGGFGSSSVYHTDKVLRLSQDLPIVIEVIEANERIEQILPQLDEMIGGGLVTLEKVRVILYRSHK
jgi:PII-like signaling protein